MYKIIIFLFDLGLVVSCACIGPPTHQDCPTLCSTLPFPWCALAIVPETLQLELLGWALASSLGGWRAHGWGQSKHWALRDLSPCMSASDSWPLAKLRTYCFWPSGGSNSLGAGAPSMAVCHYPLVRVHVCSRGIWP